VYDFVGEARRVDTAIERASELRSEAILLPDDMRDAPTVAIATRLREADPGGKMVVVGEEPHHDFLVGLAQAGVDAYLPWRNATELGVFYCLMAVLQAGLKVGTERALEELVVVPERRRRQYIESLHLSDLELSVLEGLAAGLTYHEIAEHAHTSVATVGRTAGELKEKLGASTHHALVALAIDLGFGRQGGVERLTQGGEISRSRS